MIQIRGNELEALKMEFIGRFIISIVEADKLSVADGIKLLKESSAWDLLIEKVPMADCCRDGG